MLKKSNIGASFYYANRNTGKAEKCIITDFKLGYPMKLIAKKEDTGEMFICYSDFGCFDNEADAIIDAQIKEDRIIY